MAIKPLNPHYSMTTPASVYDEEAMTALELAGRTAAKVNETVEAFNDHEAKMTKAFSDHEANTKEEIDKIPEMVERSVLGHIDDGEFDKQINEYIGNLDDRIDNLVEAYDAAGGVGSPADAELYDIRVGVKAGEVYDNAGDAVRAKANLNEINHFFDNDLFTAQSENLYPFDRDTFSYAGGETFKHKATGAFNLNGGHYVLVVTNTNADRVLITYRESANGIDFRAADIINPKAAAYPFTIPEGENRIVAVHYGVNANREPKEYYFDRAYIFPRGSVKIPSEFVHTGASILESAEVIAQKGVNLYTGGEKSPFEFDGVTLEQTIQYEQVLSAGDYLINITKPLPRVIIATEDGTRFLDETDMQPNEVYAFFIPEGVEKVLIIGYMSTSTQALLPAGKYEFNGITILPDNGKPFLPDYLTRFNEIGNMVEQKMPRVGGRFLFASGDVTANGVLEIENETHVKRNYTISFNATFEQFRTVRIGQGKTSYGGFYTEITTTTINCYSYTDKSTMTTNYAHGLTISEFINVNIHVVNEKACITITTANGSYTLANTVWTGCNGKVFAEVVDYPMTLCELKWNSPDIDKKVWIMGDSYMGSANNRLIGQLIKRNYNNFLVSGFPGGGSNDEYKSLVTLLTLGTPDVILWCVGMNDGDSNGGVNTNWLRVQMYVRKLCTEKNITLILATIPNTPIVDNSGKNHGVEVSGYRYIDFNKAVVQTGNTWYTGMLDADNVHPTETGASVLVNRMLLDAPELMR